MNHSNPMNRSSLAVLAFICLAANPVADAAHQIVSEFTFDNGPDDSGPAQGHALLDDLDGTTTLTLTGPNPPVRSKIGEGRYGRAGKFPGGAGNRIKIEGLPSSFKDNVFGLVAWFKPDFSDTAGEILTHENNWSLYLQNGTVKLVVATPAGAQTKSFISIPNDGEWHQVAFQWYVSIGVAAVQIDQNSSPQTGIFPPPGVPGEIHMGNDYSGLIDEVIMYGGASGTALAFDRDPAYCPGGHTCLEDVINVTPIDYEDQPWEFQVPVRFKLVYDASECTATSPCPIVIDISGGFACADDYDNPSEVDYMASRGIIVVAVDPYCGVLSSVQEVPQLIAVKDYLFNDSLSPFNHANSPAYDRAVTSGYMASGCSHGANNVIHWALGDESDRPNRTFSRSGIASISEPAHCGVHHDPTMCSGVAGLYEDIYAWLSQSSPHDDDDAGFRAKTTVDWATLASTREIALIWGVDTTPASPTCNSDGSYDCLEQGGGITYASRHTRDKWHAAEGVVPTGYFVEDDSGDCIHCPKSSDASFQCGVCFLKAGRNGMSSACPQCLPGGALGLSEGGSAAACSIMNNW